MGKQGAPSKGTGSGSASGRLTTARNEPAWQGSGEEFYVHTRERSDARDGVLQLFAIVTYPHRSESRNRDLAVRALDAGIQKARIWNQRFTPAVRMTLAQTIREMKIQQIDGKLRKLGKRLIRRLDAGNFALRYHVAGQKIPYKSRFITLARPLGAPSGSMDGIELCAPESETDALRDLLAARGRAYGGPHGDMKPAIENERTLTLHQSAPVLHLCVVLFGQFAACAGNEAMFFRTFFDLVENPGWLHNALIRAEHLRTLLHDDGVGFFNPARALRFLPAEYLPSGNTRP